MIKHLKNLLSPIMMALVLTGPQIIQAMDEAEKILFPNSNLTPDVEGLILEIVVKDNCDKFGCARHVEPICKTWYNFVNEKRYISPLCKNNLMIGLQTKFLYDMFCNGELVFRPNPGSDEGMILLKISDLANPSEDTFNLTLCGDAGEYFSISTGYPKVKIAENVNKIEIWFAPREFIKQELQGDHAQQFSDIFKTWKPSAQVGIFWTWANRDDLNSFYYLTGSDNLTLSSENLYEYSKCSGATKYFYYPMRPVIKKFHVHFK